MQKRLYYVVIAVIVVVSLSCGKKGDLILPVIPRPMPARSPSAEILAQGVQVSWNPPTAYSTGIPLTLTKDIEKITIFRKRESISDTIWDFSWTREDWTAAGQTLPIKWSKGVLRAASNSSSVFLASPKNLELSAEANPYIRLHLWSKNSDRAYLAFITAEDGKWDTDLSLIYQPAVHTSAYAYQREFNNLKLISFPLDSKAMAGQSNRPYEYVIDMRKVPMWKGKIQQFGILLRNRTPDASPVEIGLDRVELTNTLTSTARLYDCAPWLFLEDEEGWTSNRPENVFGAAQGLLYTQGAAATMLMSAPGQNIERSTLSQIQIRMRVTAGTRAYVLLWTPLEEQRWRQAPQVIDLASKHVFPITLTQPDAFQTYTIDVHALATESTGITLSGSERISVIGLFFPALPDQQERHILIDSIYTTPSQGDQPLLRQELAAHNLASFTELSNDIQQQSRLSKPDFDIPYAALPEAKEVTLDQTVKLAEVSPKKPAPVVIQENGQIVFTDTGNFKSAPLNYGERYTYTIEFTDRKHQTSGQSGVVTVEYAAMPGAPYALSAETKEDGIHLRWNRPFLAQDGKKIRSFAGYQILRSLVSGQYTDPPLQKTGPYDTTFIDRNVSHGTTYYYKVQSLASASQNASPQTLSEEVATLSRDSTPPGIPSGFTGLYVKGVVRLYWNAPQSADLGGFNIYRSLNQAQDFRRMNDQPVLQDSYEDRTVEEGKAYDYYVTAFDTTVPPNESQPSVVITIQAQSLQ